MGPRNPPNLLNYTNHNSCLGPCVTRDTFTHNLVLFVLPVPTRQASRSSVGGQRTCPWGRSLNPGSDPRDPPREPGTGV